jgi:methylenetetrahydrofolate--tRNA-(uracil-5-)-methyltransferase
MPDAVVIGAGLAGSEAAWQLAARGMAVRLIEMRPTRMTPAHTGPYCAELVCSNSFKSLVSSSAQGCLKHELAALGSVVLECALKAGIDAGRALAVDRLRFSKAVTEKMAGHRNIDLQRFELTSLEGLLDTGAQVIVATGPLTSDALASSLVSLTGAGLLSFYDAAAPVVDAASLDMGLIFPQSRYGQGADYLNAPFDREQYECFWRELVAAKRVIAKDFERRELFSACQPVEEVARSGIDSLRFGAMKPVGITDPRTLRRPWAVVQLRAENREKTAWNLVGFQTSLTFPEQERVFRMIPGLGDAEFVRLGVMHRNTFIDSPQALGAAFEHPSLPQLRFAGQITGTEGYAEAVASGLYAALSAFAQAEGLPAVTLPRQTAFGALVAYATSADTCNYQPMHVNFGIMPPLEARPRSKRERYAAYAARARHAMEAFVASRPDLGIKALDMPLPHIEEA